MGEQKRIKTKVVLKHQLEAHWLLSSYVPDQGEIVIYDAEVDENGQVLQLPGNRSTPYTHQRLKLGDGYHSVNELSFVSSVKDVQELPTEDIDPDSIYRLLTAHMVMDRAIQTNAVCHIVDALGSTGESFITYIGTNNYNMAGYYNKSNDKLYCYIDQATKDALYTIVDETDLNDLEKLAAKGIILALSTGWKDTAEVLGIIGSFRDDLTYGGVITSLDQAVGNNVLYVYLTTEFYQNVGGKWLTNSNESGRISVLENHCTSFHVQGTTANLPAFNLNTSTGEITFLNPCIYIYNNKFGSIPKDTVVSGATASNTLALVALVDGGFAIKNFADIESSDIVIFNMLRWARECYYNPDCISIPCIYEVDGTIVARYETPYKPEEHVELLTIGDKVAFDITPDSTGKITVTFYDCYFRYNGKRYNISKNEDKTEYVVCTSNSTKTTQMLVGKITSTKNLYATNLTFQDAETYSLKSDEVIIMVIAHTKNETNLCYPGSISTKVKYSVNGKICGYQPITLDTVYVSNAGNDANNGLSMTAAFNTLTKALDSGAETIIVAPGIYRERFNIDEVRNNLTIKVNHVARVDGESLEDWRARDAVIITAKNEDGSFTSSTGMSYLAAFRKINNLVLEDLIFQESDVGSLCSILNCANFTVRNCQFIAAHDGHGVQVNGSSGEFINCKATYAGKNIKGERTATDTHRDGFNIHGAGSINLINCVAAYNLDDGVSHHDLTSGFISGGEYYNNGKAGIASPTYGAKVNIHNVDCHNNPYGVYTEYSEDMNSTESGGSVQIFNSIITNNSMAGVLAKGYDVYAYSCLFEGNIQEHIERNGGTFTADNCVHHGLRLTVTEVQTSNQRLTFDMTGLVSGIKLSDIFSAGQKCTVLTSVGPVELTIKQTGDARLIFNESVTKVAIGDILTPSSTFDNVKINANEITAKSLHTNTITADSAWFSGDVSVGDKGKLVTEDLVAALEARIAALEAQLEGLATTLQQLNEGGIE